ncbi:MAG: glycosyltransferase [Flavobacteriaceae bacterium]|nr:glycosyltransferase [Flavobacteriaceae bacterium]
MKKKRKIKLLMFAELDSPLRNAQDRDALQWALYLNSSKFDITSFSSTTADKRIISKNNIKLIKLSKHKYLRHFKMTLSLFSPFYSHILLAKPNLNVLIYLFFITKLPFLKKKIIISLVNRLPYGLKLESILYNQRFFQFAISDQIKKDFYKLTGRKTSIVRLVYDLNLFFPPENKNKSKKIVCIGSLQIRKNPFLFANLAKIFPQNEFYWIGDGYYYDWIVEKKERASIKNLNLIKHLNQTELAEFIRACSIFLFPSIHEGFPNVIVEALATGLPVITMNSYGPDAIINGYNGFIVETEFEMQDKLNLLLSNNKLLRTMSKNARKSSEIYSGKNAINLLETFLTKI